MNKQSIARITSVEPNRLHAKDIDTKELLVTEVDEVVAEDFQRIFREKSLQGEGVFMTREEFFNG